MTKAQIWGVAIFLVLMTGATILAAMFSNGTTVANSSFKATTAAAVDAADHVRNAQSGTLTLIEYGDFECPACGAYEPLVEQLLAAYPTQITFVFRHFPLYQIHPNAMITAQAAEAAGLQGKFWEMHDLLYQKQNDWATASQGDMLPKYLDAYAQSLGLDVTKFNTDINSSAVKARVQRDISSGNAASIDHTPTFFINQTQIQNPQNYAAFKSVIDAALASSTTR